MTNNLLPLKQKKINLAMVSVLFSLLVLLSVQISAAARPTLNSPNLPDAAPVLVYSSPVEIILQYNTPQHTVSPTGAYQNLSLPGSDLLQDPGYPTLPVVHILVGIPPGAEASLQSQILQSNQLAGTYNLSLAPEPLPIEDDFTPGGFKETSTPAPELSTGLYPSSPASITGEAWFRGYRMITVSLYPFQYNLASGTLIKNDDFQVNINLTDALLDNTCGSTCAPDPIAAELLSGTLINFDTAQAWRVAPSSTAYQEAITAPAHALNYAPSGERYEIHVTQDGIYQLTYTDLLNAGLDPEGINPHNLKMTSQGLDVAIIVTDESDNTFDPGDRILFYGEAFKGDQMELIYQDVMTQPNNSRYDQAKAPNNWLWQCNGSCDLGNMFEKYANTNVYWLYLGEAPGPRMESVSAAPAGAPLSDYHMHTVHAEENHEWWSHEFTSEESLFWEKINYPIWDVGAIRSADVLTQTYNINLTNIATDVYTATLHAEIASRKSNSNSPNHHNKFYLNDDPTVIEDAIWDGNIRYAFDADFSSSILLEGSNTLAMTLEKLSDEGNVTLRIPYLYFDFFEITYAREYHAIDDQLIFTPPISGTWQYQVTELTTPDILSFDITNPTLPRVISDTVVSGTGPHSVSFQTTLNGYGRYAVAADPALLSPVSMTYYPGFDFSTIPEVDYLLILPEAFASAAQPLIDHRTAHGLTAVSVNWEDVYREFNFGIPHPIAIKNLLAYAFSSWSQPPTYVNLVGAGHLNLLGDSLNLYPENPTIYMPPNLAYVDPWQGEVDSVNLLATIVGDDTMPDVMISRMLVDSVDAFSKSINSIIAYENQPPMRWNNNILFVADNNLDLAGDFVTLSNTIIQTYIGPDPSLKALRIYEDDFECFSISDPGCSEVTEAITETLNTQGALIINYVGHGSVTSWSHEQILTNEDVTSLTNENQLPILLSMTCLDGLSIIPGYSSLAQSLFLHDGGGVIASFSPNGLGVATGHDYLHHGFYDGWLNNDLQTLGEAAQAAKLRLFASASNQDLMHTYTVYGDPALRIKQNYPIHLPIVYR